jgi:hypothetical protein
VTAGHYKGGLMELIFTLSCDDLKIEIPVSVTITGNYSPGEMQTRDHPGCNSSVEIDEVSCYWPDDIDSETKTGLYTAIESIIDANLDIINKRLLDEFESADGDYE